MNIESNVGQAVELIRLKVSPEKLPEFLAGRKQVDAFVATLPGYLSTEIVQLSDQEYLILIRWASHEIVLEAQKVTNQSELISNWISSSGEFISFETSTVKYVSAQL